MLRPLITLLLLCSFVAVVAAQPASDAVALERAELTQMLGAQASVFEKAKACQRLAVIGDETSVAALAPLLLDPQLSAYARTALEQIPGEAAVRALVEAASKLRAADGEERGVDEAQRQRRLIGLLHSLGRRSAVSAQSLLQTIADDPRESAAVRQLAVRVLATSDSEAGPEAPDSEAPGEVVAGDAASDLAAWLGGDDPQRFRQGLHRARQNGAAAAGALAEVLAQLSPTRQTLVLGALADLGEEEHLPAIKPLTQADQDEVAAAAWQAIGRLGGFRDGDAADAALQAAIARPAIATRLLVALADAGSPSVDAAIDKLLTDLAAREQAAEPELATGLIAYAQARPLPQAIKPLLQIARVDGRPAVVASALQTAAAVTPAENLAELLRVSETAAERFEAASVSSAAQLAIEQASVRMPPDQVAEVVATLLADAQGARRQRWMEHLAFAGGERALQIVAAAARSDQPTEVDLATRVLGQWLWPDAAPVLRDLASELPQPNYRLRALRGYLRIGRQFDMPAKQRVELAAQACALADRPEERAMALDILARYPSFEALQWLAEQSGAADQQQRQTLNQTLLRVAQSVASDQSERFADWADSVDLADLPEGVRKRLQQLAQSPQQAD